MATGDKVGFGSEWWHKATLGSSKRILGVRERNTKKEKGSTFESSNSISLLFEIVMQV